MESTVASQLSLWTLFIQAMSRRALCVLVFEDLHWADDPMLDFLDYLASEIDRSSNRMAFSIFLAALIIGSSMLVHLPPDQSILNLPIRYFGIIGFALSFFMGIGLLYAILRSGKLS